MVRGLFTVLTNVVISDPYNKTSIDIRLKHNTIVSSQNPKNARFKTWKKKTTEALHHNFRCSLFSSFFKCIHNTIRMYY